MHGVVIQEIIGYVQHLPQQARQQPHQPAQVHRLRPRQPVQAQRHRHQRLQVQQRQAKLLWEHIFHHYREQKGDSKLELIVFRSAHKRVISSLIQLIIVGLFTMKISGFIVL